MFEVAGKDPAWYTAFYYLGEHLRAVSHGAVNHKVLFDAVGSDGSYYNHGNPLVRKQTAGSLSRIVHSPKYADSMRCRCEAEPAAFAHASRTLLETVYAEGVVAPDDLLAYLAERCLPDVVAGLENECSKHGRPVDIYRAECEAGALLGWIFERELDPQADSGELAENLLEGMLRFLAFGHLESAFAESLVQETPLFDEAPRVAPRERQGVCLARYESAASGLTGRRWMLDPDEVFSIGRFTTCNAIETSSAISRVHCRIYCEGETWYLRDCGSKRGCAVLRAGEGVVYDSLHAERAGSAPEPFPLQFEDRIDLAGGSSRYLFALVG